MGGIDPVARFHLGNGARLERINWLGNTSGRGMRESYGVMVNYLYDPDAIEANHEVFVHAARWRAPPRWMGCCRRPASQTGNRRLRGAATASASGKAGERPANRPGRFGPARSGA